MDPAARDRRKKHFDFETNLCFIQMSGSKSQLKRFYLAVSSSGLIIQHECLKKDDETLVLSMSNVIIEYEVSFILLVT